MALTKAAEDLQREKPVITRQHEWAHGEGGRGKACDRAAKPVFTPPNEAPGVCRDYKCDNDEWLSRGYVLRDRKKKEVVHREKCTA